MNNAPDNESHFVLLCVADLLLSDGWGVGKSTARTGVRSKFKDFQSKPDFVVSPKLGASLKTYIQDFKKIMGAR